MANNSRTERETMRPRLSLCMIVKNEERYLEDCLASVQDVVDEMIVVDSGSTDRTVEIALQFGAKVIPFVWNNDFAAARNESLRHATGKWILYLDADERLASGQEALLRKLLAAKNTFAYSVIVEGDHYLPSGVVRQRMAYPRLFRRHPTIRFEGKVHEQIMPALRRLGCTVAPSALTILHLGYAQSLDVVQQKCRRNIELLTDQLHQNPDDAYARYQLGSTYAVLGEVDNARRELEQACRSQQLATNVRASAMNLLAELAIRDGDYATAIQHGERSLQLAPRQSLARWFLAAAAISQGQYDTALRFLQELLTQTDQLQAPHLGTVAHDVEIEQWKIFLQMGLCYERTGKFQEAFHAYVNARARCSNCEVADEALERLVPFLPDYRRAIEELQSAGFFLFSLYRRGVDGALQAGRPAEALRYLDLIVANSAATLPPHITERLKKLQSAMLS
jgi:tetratricopeptide (TPR) repeat protein